MGLDGDELEHAALHDAADESAEVQLGAAAALTELEQLAHARARLRDIGAGGALREVHDE